MEAEARYTFVGASVLVLIAALLIIIGNILSDVLYAVADPRIRLS